MPARRLPAWDFSPVIVSRISFTNDSALQVARDYGCSDSTIRNIIAAVVPFEVRHRLWTFKKAMARRGVKTGIPPTNGFKRGEIRGAAARRYVPVGTIRVARTRAGRPYRIIKFADVPGATGLNWKPLARWRWEQAHGRVAQGWCVIYRDRNTMRDELDNLLCVPNHEKVMRRLRDDPAKAEQRRRRIAASCRERAEWGRQKRLIRSGEVATCETKPCRSAKDVARERVAAFLKEIAA